MGQYEIMKLLNRNIKKWFTIDEISDRLKINKSSVSKNLMRMGGEVEWRHRIEDFKINPKKEFKLRDETQRKIWEENKF